MRIRTGLVSVLSFAVACAQLFEIHATNACTQNDKTPRGLYISKSADAMRVRVLDVDTGAPVSPSRRFTKDDRLQVIVESNFEGYLYVLNVEVGRNSEKRFLLYPNPAAGNNRVTSSEPFKLSVSFDEKPATEVLQVIVSHDRIAYLDAAVNQNCSSTENRCELDAPTATRAASIAGRSQPLRRNQAGGIFPRRADKKRNDSGLVSRDIVLAAGKEKEDAGATYVAIPLGAAVEGRLKSNEAFVFEIRLKHI